MPPTAAAAAANPPEVKDSSPLNDSILKAAQQFGLPLVMLGVILWWAKNDLVQPLLDAHFTVIEKIVDGQKEHSEKLDNIGDKLDELIKVSK